MRLWSFRTIVKKLWEAATNMVRNSEVSGRLDGLTYKRESVGCMMAAIYRSRTYMWYTHSDRDTHTVRHSKINAVRATMIPLHYLHTGPPSCARLPHCPLHCFSIEVVITKANILLSVPSATLHSPIIFSFFCILSSAVPAFRQMVTQLKVCQCWWQCQHDPLCVSGVFYYEIIWCPADVQ